MRPALLYGQMARGEHTLFPQFVTPFSDTASNGLAAQIRMTAALEVESDSDANAGHDSNFARFQTSEGDPMSIVDSNISDLEAAKVEATHEDQFSDVKAIDISPSKLSNTIAALANSDGGDLYIGIDEE